MLFLILINCIINNTTYFNVISKRCSGDNGVLLLFFTKNGETFINNWLYTSNDILMTFLYTERTILHHFLILELMLQNVQAHSVEDLQDESTNIVTSILCFLLFSINNIKPIICRLRFFHNKLFTLAIFKTFEQITHLTWLS